MDITVYLPDAVGERAKGAGLNLSRLLRDAVERELARSETVNSTLADTTEHEVRLEDDEGRLYTGRITGVELVYDARTEVTVFLTDDERLIVYDGRKLTHLVVDEPEDLEDWLEPVDYAAAMGRLGQNVVIDL